MYKLVTSKKLHRRPSKMLLGKVASNKSQDLSTLYNTKTHYKYTLDYTHKSATNTNFGEKEEANSQLWMDDFKRMQLVSRNSGFALGLWSIHHVFLGTFVSIYVHAKFNRKMLCILGRILFFCKFSYILTLAILLFLLWQSSTLE